LGEVKQAAPGPRDGQPQSWHRPWLPWAVGLGLLLLGAFVGWASSYLALSPLLGLPAGTPRSAGKATPAGEGARVEAILPTASAGPALVAPGEQVILSWQVWNTGGAAWAADTYRFALIDDRSGVIPLPHAVPPGESLTVRAVVTVPDVSAVWEPTWQLTGPRGPVPGGTLSASLQVRAAEPDAAPAPDPGGT
jgi:hypothetical protein